jgi:hypothetical protein
VARSILHLPAQRRSISRAGIGALLTGAGFEQISVTATSEPVSLLAQLRAKPGRVLAASTHRALEVLYGRPSFEAFATKPNRDIG